MQSSIAFNLIELVSITVSLAAQIEDNLSSERVLVRVCCFVEGKDCMDLIGDLGVIAKTNDWIKRMA